jgi:transcriptional regulator GlxA family with amidase domain
MSPSVSIAELVRKSGLPKRSFDRRFRAATGYSPLSYIQTLRVEEAKQMLETNTVAVEQIGQEVGYEDAASFRRLFRRLTGMTPREYRRNFQLPSSVVGKGTVSPVLHSAKANKMKRAALTDGP